MISLATSNTVCTIIHCSKVLPSHKCCAYMHSGDRTRRGVASTEFQPRQFFWRNQGKSVIEPPPMQPEYNREFVLVELSVGRDCRIHSIQSPINYLMTSIQYTCYRSVPCIQPTFLMYHYILEGCVCKHIPFKRSDMTFQVKDTFSTPCAVAVKTSHLCKVFLYQEK